ncbi:MAG: TlpA family protein disulfide reductase [Gammaproteobacteria bacterium]|nr:TlpA family protein disulfide reductase [Gammaproteobacteria bacterium]
MAGSYVSAGDDAIQLKRISYSQWQEKLKSYPPDIVVVDMWATWCVSCIERFPKMIELHRQYHQQGVRFVSMCLDERDDQPAITRAEKFLQKNNAVFENYLMDENLMQAFEMLDLIGIPVVLIYDRNGQEHFRLTGDNPNKQFTDKDVEAAIQQLLQ